MSKISLGNHPLDFPIVWNMESSLERRRPLKPEKESAETMGYASYGQMMRLTGEGKNKQLSGQTSPDHRCAGEKLKIGPSQARHEEPR